MVTIKHISYVATTLILFSTLADSQGEAGFTVDEFSRANCEEFLARADNFFIQLHNNPTGNGFVIIEGDNKFLRKKLTYEEWWYGAVALRKFDGSRVRIIHASETG